MILEPDNPKIRELLIEALTDQDTRKYGQKISMLDEEEQDYLQALLFSLLPDMFL